MLKLLYPSVASSTSRQLIPSRGLRKRAPIISTYSERVKEAEFLKDATTFSDVHSVIMDPHSGLPYPPEQVEQYLQEKETEQKKSLKSKDQFKSRKLSKLNFDHIPIDEQVVALFPGQGAQHLKMGEKVSYISLL